MIKDIYIKVLYPEHSHTPALQVAWFSWTRNISGWSASPLSTRGAGQLLPSAQNSHPGVQLLRYARILHIFWDQSYCYGSRGGNATPLYAPLPEPGELIAPRSPHPPTMLASQNVRHSAKPYHMPQTLLLSTTDRNCRPTWHKFQPQGGKSTPYTVHIQNTPIKLALFEFCGSGPAPTLWPWYSVAPNQEKLHATPSPV
jgi:hypothetical protein